MEITKDISELPNSDGIVIHSSFLWFERLQAGKSMFFAKLEERAALEQVPIFLVDAENTTSQRLRDLDHVHLYLRYRNPYINKGFHIATGYIRGFWYCDPKGVNWNSSIVNMEFDPKEIEFDAARRTYYGIRGFVLPRNTSRHSQPIVKGDPLPPAAATIYLQDLENKKYSPHFLRSEEMIKTAAECIDGRVYVKFHPLQTMKVREYITELCAEYKSVEIVDRSIHELNEISDLIITQNSAAAFEALFHKKPIITCGKSDFHHASIVARTISELERGIGTAARRLVDFQYAKYFHWFLAEQLLEVEKPEFADRLWARIMTRNP
ncbi:capsular polysaccharide export protein, LipB/KpsS family [Litoreibacter roseus]|uniref:Capsule polysaccharide biosynthesis protein n=1 Tax=Litoreibacter roseus TaxID=2601869 RepID=A0A6N6JHZ6_9RHOB|nr:hypothetical protein [Litoreibacter roseus]GFE65557.1 hypothetical protein KIN_26310 [Litoreibacter roseus]